MLIIGTAAGVACALLLAPVVDTPEYLARMSESAGRVLAGVVLQLVMALACAGIGIALFPVLRRHGEGLALGAAGFRIIEGALGVAGTVFLVSLLTLSRAFIQAGAPGGSYFQTAGALLLAGRSWATDVAMVLAWCTGAFLYYWLFYRSRLLPRWLSAWGLAGLALSLAATLLLALGLLSSRSVIHTLLHLPIAVQEMVLAVWLILRGFDSPAVGLKTAPATVAS